MAKKVVAAVVVVLLVALLYFNSSLVKAIGMSTVLSPASGVISSPSPPPVDSRAACFEFSGWGPNTSSALEAGQWYFSDKNITAPSCVREYRLEVPGCSIVQLTPSAMRQCLRGKHIVFIGDSLVRYMFQWLVIFLLSGEGAEPFNCCREPFQYNSWMRKHLDMLGCNGPVRCDRVAEKIMENIYLYDWVNEFNVSFIGYFDHGYGRAPVGFHHPLPPGTPIPSDLLWNEAHIPDLAKVIGDHFGKVDEIFVNSGQWHVHEFEQTVELAMDQLRPLADVVKDGKKPVWITSNRNFGFPRPDLELGTQAANALGFRVFDRKMFINQVLEKVHNDLGYPDDSHMVFIDEVHFQPYINGQLNNALFNMFCDVSKLNLTDVGGPMSSLVGQ